MASRAATAAQVLARWPPTALDSAPAFLDYLRRQAGATITPATTVATTATTAATITASTAVTPDTARLDTARPDTARLDTAGPDTASPDTANPAGPTEAILALFENQYGKKYPLSPAFLAPTANPAYYQTVAAKVEQVLAARSELEASGYSLRARLRLWFAIFWGRMRRKVRWR